MMDIIDWYILFLMIIGGLLILETIRFSHNMEKKIKNEAVRSESE